MGSESGVKGEGPRENERCGVSKGKVPAGLDEHVARTCQGVGAGLGALQTTMSLELAAGELTIRKRGRGGRAGMNTCVEVQEQVWEAGHKEVTCEWKGVVPCSVR